MVEIDVAKIHGIGEWTVEERKDERAEISEQIYRIALAGDEENGDGENGAGKAFLVLRPKTLEVRCERNLGRKLRDEYETVMESRYFGRGGIEIVPSRQLETSEIEDLIRLSYNLTRDLAE